MLLCVATNPKTEANTMEIAKVYDKGEKILLIGKTDEDYFELSIVIDDGAVIRDSNGDTLASARIIMDDDPSREQQLLDAIVWFQQAIQVEESCIKPNKVLSKPFDTVSPYIQIPQSQYYGEWEWDGGTTGTPTITTTQPDWQDNATITFTGADISNDLEQKFNEVKNKSMLFNYKTFEE